MVLYGLLCTLGIRGGLTLGYIGAELLTSYWNCRNSRDNTSQRSKVHVLNRRLHHGEIGAVLALSSLILRATSVPTAAAAIVAGIGMGLVKDDHADIEEWFRFKKKNFEEQKRTNVKVTSLEHQNDVSVTEDKQYEYSHKSKRRSDIFDTLLYPDQGDKKIVEKLILEPLQKQVRNLIDTQSQTMKQIESQIKKSRNQLQLKKG
jgi:hypothetical protein